MYMDCVFVCVCCLLSFSSVRCVLCCCYAVLIVYYVASNLFRYYFLVLSIIRPGIFNHFGCHFVSYLQVEAMLAELADRVRIRDEDRNGVGVIFIGLSPAAAATAIQAHARRRISASRVNELRTVSADVAPTC